VRGVFILTALITIALTARSQHGIDSAVVWWNNFLVASTALYFYAKNIPLKSLKYIYAYALLNYLLFHPWHFWGVKDLFDWFEWFSFEFWPISLLSFIIVTRLVYSEIKNGCKCH
jgi:hypothetical protein